MSVGEWIIVGWLFALTVLVLVRGGVIAHVMSKTDDKVAGTNAALIAIGRDIDRIETRFRSFTPHPPLPPPTFTTMAERQINCEHEMDSAQITQGSGDQQIGIGRTFICKKCGYYRDHYLHDHIPDGYLERFPDAEPRMLVDHETNPSWPLVKAPDPT